MAPASVMSGNNLPGEDGSVARETGGAPVSRQGEPVRMALSLSYDGNGWQGWQTQPGGNTLQDALESAASQFLAHPVSTICAGRTDTGVHALSQIVHLDTTARRNEESWVRGLNALLPPRLAVQWAVQVPQNFHARFSAVARTYVYVVRNSRVRSPLLHGRVGWVYHALDLERMQEASLQLLGEHDFSSFRSSECQAASPVRTMQAVEIARQGEFFLFRFTANAFLHHMIRNLMGALLYIGMGRQPVDWIAHLLAQKDRRFSAPTFAAEGLYLAHVDYGDSAALPQVDWRDALFSHTGIVFPERVSTQEIES